MLLPCAITPIVRVTGSDIIADLKAGMTGIFMPIEYDDKSSRWMENGAELDKRELADYGFADGMYFLRQMQGLRLTGMSIRAYPMPQRLRRWRSI